MGTETERRDEMFGDLAEAVYAGDLVRAEGVLELMHASGQRSQAIREAKYKARPETARRVTPPLAQPLTLPQPGRSGAEVFGRGGNVVPQGRLRK